MKSFLAALTALAFSATAAQAAFIDFVADAAANPGGFAQGTTKTFGNIDVTITANPSNPFLDDLFNSKPGGLGACITIKTNAGFCDPKIVGNSDNIGAGESVTLDFGQKVDISNLSFNAINHASLNNSPQTLLVNGVEWTFKNLLSAVLTGVSVLTLAYGGSNAAEFYVSSLTAVPLPAAAPLLFSGLAGLAFAGRRKRKTA
ncbi:MAG: VPLPA-CTERM sorting domain-containing protein [Pseudomonadota bacterium]